MVVVLDLCHTVCQFLGAFMSEFQFFHKGKMCEICYELETINDDEKVEEFHVYIIAYIPLNDK